MRTITLYLDCFLAKSEPRTSWALAKEEGYVRDLETAYENNRVDEGEDELVQTGSVRVSTRGAVAR